MSYLRKQHLKQFQIQNSSRYIKILPLRQDFETQILIEKRTSKVLLGDKKILYKQSQTKDVQIKTAALIMGVIAVQSQKFLVYAENVYPQASMPKEYTIYQIADVNFIPFSPIMPKTKQLLEIVQKEIFGFSFYFSFDRDLTLSFQNFYQEENKSRDRYFWNKEMLSHMLGQKRANDSETSQSQKNEWTIPIIQGYYGMFQFYFKQQLKVQVYLISRRSKYRSGTRFYNRGIQESGRCANFIQSQIAVVYNDNLVSVKYYSGSVPIFWQQKSQLSKIKITRDKQLQLLPFKKHLKTLIADSGHVMLINLLEKKKQEENILIKQYEYLVQANQKQFEQTVRYAFFDINMVQKNKQYDKIWEFLETILPITDVFKGFQINLKTNIIISRQKGSYRVSCLDCLARTNKFLQVLSFQAVSIVLEKFNLFKQGFKTLALDLITKDQDKLEPFLRYYRSLWEQKGQFQSIIYAGTSSTQSKKTKFLSHIQNTIISLQRYYNQKFIDQLKQQGLDIILYHKNYEHLFRKKHQLPFNISIVTWNVNATDPQKMKDLPFVLNSMEGSDLIVIGLQEMVQLNANNVMNDNTQESKQTQKWQKYLISLLSDKTIIKGDYIFVQKVQMVGLFLIIFINKKWVHALKSIHKDMVKTGMKIGMSEKYGNKGGVVIRLNIFETSITFTCAHLAAHQSKVQERVNDFLQIHKKAFQQNKQSIQNQLQIDFSDYKFFFGDLNFRLNGQFKELKAVIQNNVSITDPKQLQKAIDKLQQIDQLRILMNQDQQVSQYFKFYQQSKIKFFPTYKLDKKTGEYTLEKERNPSYCDRILYWMHDQEGLNIQQDLYTDIQAKGSDHRPVLGKFKINILKQTRKNSQSIIMEESFVEESSYLQHLHNKTSQEEEIGELVSSFKRKEQVIEDFENDKMKQKRYQSEKSQTKFN